MGIVENMNDCSVLVRLLLASYSEDNRVKSEKRFGTETKTINNLNEKASQAGRIDL
jgi:hypothetical protein